MNFDKVLKEMIKKTWTNADLSDSWQGEIVVGGIPFDVSTEYDADYTIDDGDEYTPPDTTVTNVELYNTKIVQFDYHSENEIEVTEQTDPDLYKIILNKVEEEVVKEIYEYHLS